VRIALRIVGFLLLAVGGLVALASSVFVAYGMFLLVTSGTALGVIAPGAIFLGGSVAAGIGVCIERMTRQKTVTKTQ
jgi:pantothenate kinase type III